MKQIDTGITNSLWGLNDDGKPFVFDNVTWVPVSGIFTYVTSGQAGVWAVMANRDIFYREGISHLNPTGMKWKHVGGGLQQIDSGPAGVVYGIDENHDLLCRDGIKPGSPVGLLWTRIQGSYKHVTCGSKGCWALTTNKEVLYRFGIRPDFCKGKLWIPVPSPVKMKYIEAGSEGSLWAVSEAGEVWYRDGVDELHPYGQRWKKEGSGGGYNMVTVGLNGEYALKNSGDIYHLKSE